MPCGCVIGDQYLPLQGGERHVECEHAEYVIAGTRVTAMRFSITKVTKKGEEEDEGEPE